MGTIIVIPADMALPVRSWEADEQPALQDLQDMVGGYIEAVPLWERHLDRPCVVWCNEEGKLDGLPGNERATAMWWEALGGGIFNDHLVGDIVIVVDLPDRDEDDEGEDA
jgi:hypothetical protein